MKYSKLPTLVLAASACLVVAIWAGRTDQFRACTGQHWRLQGGFHVRSRLSCAKTCSSLWRCRGYCHGRQSNLCFLDSADGDLSSPQGTGQDELKCFAKCEALWCFS